MSDCDEPPPSPTSPTVEEDECEGTDEGMEADEAKAEDEDQQLIEDEEDEEEGQKKKPKKQKTKKRKINDEDDEDDEDDKGDKGEPERAQEEDGEEGGGYKDEEYHGDEMSRFYVQHGAHREYAVPQAFVEHEAMKFMKVKDGEEIAQLVRFTGIKYWKNLMWYHVTILGGQNLSTKEYQQAPYACFNVPGNEDTDDSDWLRPIPSGLMKTFMPKWKKEIKLKYGNDKERCRSVLKQYAAVLEWDSASPKLDPAKLGVGRGGFKQLRNKKLKSLRTPDTKVVPRATKKQTTEGKSKARPASENDSSVVAAEDLSTCKVVMIPGAQHCFKSDAGSWYAVCDS